MRAAEALSEATGSDVAQVLGKTFLLYRAAVKPVISTAHGAGVGLFVASASAGYLLRVDLTTGSCQREPLAASLLQDCLGGRGLGTALLQEFCRR